MKILFLPAYFQPENIADTHITKTLMKRYAEEGIEMIVHAPIPTRGINKETKNKYKKIRYEEQYNGKLKIKRFYAPQEKKSIILRGIRYIYCNCMHFIKGFFTKDVDLISISSTPPTQGLMGCLLKKIKKVPVLYIVQDIFPDSAINSGIIKEDSIISNALRRLEKKIYLNVDKIIVVSEDFKKNLLSKGVDENKIELVYNWIDEKNITPIKKEDNFLFEQFGLDINKFYVTYAGNMGKAQNIDIIINAAKQLEIYKNIKFLIFGTGSNLEYYKNKVIKLKLENIIFLPFQSSDKVSYVYSLSDVSIVSCKKGFGKIAMPSKTWSIMATKTPVIASFDEGTELESLIINNKVGLFNSSDDLQGLVSNILTLYNNNNLKESMGENGFKFIRDNLTSYIGTSKYVEIVKSLNAMSKI